MPPNSNPLRPVDYTFEIHFKAFIPNTVQSAPDDPWLDEPGSMGRDFMTDNRDFIVDGGSSRIHSWAIFEKTSPPMLDSKVGPSHMRWGRISYALNGPPPSPAKLDGYAHSDSEYHYFIDTAEKGGSMQEKTVRHIPRDEGKWIDSDVDLVGEASYPFSSVSPDIDYSIRVMCSYTSSHLSVRVSGTHNRFPGYESYIKLKGELYEIYRYDPAKHGETGPGMINLNRTWKVERIRTLILPLAN